MTDHALSTPSRRGVLLGAGAGAATAALWTAGTTSASAATSTATTSTATTSATACLPLAGVNMSGLGSNPSVVDAEIGVHYRDITAQHIAASGDCPFFRLPTTAARFLVAQGYPLAETYCDQVEAVLDRIADAGKTAILELHDFMRLPVLVATKSGYTRNSSYQVVGPDGQVVPDPAAPSVWAGTYTQGPHPYSALWDSRDQLLKLSEYRVIGTPGCPLYDANGLPDLWQRLARRFGSHPAVLGWGLMNEPYTSSLERNADGTPFLMGPHWDATAAATAAALLDVDSDHWVFICGNEFGSARQWPEVSANLLDIPDPHGRIVYEAHNYLDGGGSGGGQWRDPQEDVDPDTGIAVMTPFLKALSEKGKRGYVGEHGYPAGNASAELATSRMIQYLADHHVPSTQWCFGPGWPQDDVTGMSYDVDAGTIAVKDNIAAVQPFFPQRLTDWTVTGY